MSIVINGMDMPKGNSTKNLLIYSDGRVFTGHKDDANYSAEERKTGKWYKPVGMMPPEYAGVYRCSKCDEIAPRDWKHHKQVLSNFCPNCGADMRGKQG